MQKRILGARSIFGRLSRALPSVALDNFAIIGRSLVLYSFLRTTIDCGEDTPDGFDRTSGDWSGSKYCADRCKVAERAQLIKGIMDGVEQTCQFIALPALGLLADSRGRNVASALSLAGLALSMLTLAIAAEIRSGDAILPIVVVGAVLKGASECYYLVFSAVVSDIFSGTVLRAKVYALVQIFKYTAAGIATIVVVAAIVAQNLYDYRATFWSLTFVAVCGGCAIFLFEEPLAERKPLRCAEVSAAFSRFRILAERPYLGLLGVIILCLTMAVSVISLAQAFVIAAYGWTQTAAVLVLILVGLVGFGSSLFAPWLVARYGPRNIFRLAIGLATTGLTIMTMSPLSVFFFIFGAFFLVTASIGFPAYYALVASRVHESQLASVLGVLGSIVIAATAIAYPMYAAIFRVVGSGGKCGATTRAELTFLPWLIAEVFMVAGAVATQVWASRFRDDADAKGRKPLGGREAGDEKRGTGDDIEMVSKAVDATAGASVDRKTLNLVENGAITQDDREPSAQGALNVGAT